VLVARVLPGCFFAYLRATRSDGTSTWVLGTGATEHAAMVAAYLERERVELGEV
jgi:hypothetical protein